MRENFTYSDVDKSLEVLADGNVKILYDEDVIVQSLKTLMATFRGEMPRTSIGSRMMFYLGKPMTDRITSLMEDELLEMISRYEPRVRITAVKVLAQPDEKTYDITIRMVMRNTNQSLDFRTGLRTLT